MPNEDFLQYRGFAHAQAAPPRLQRWSLTAAQTVSLGTEGKWPSAGKALALARRELARARVVWVTRAMEKVEELGKLEADWSSYGERPNHRAIKLSLDLVRFLAEHGARPRRIVPMADGGIALRFSVDDRIARIEVMNDGVVVLVTHGSAEEAHTYRVLSPQIAAAEVAQYLE